MAESGLHQVMHSKADREIKVKCNGESKGIIEKFRVLVKAHTK
jgi:hypothetical protein